MTIEHTRCARHSQKISIGSQGVFLDGIEWFAFTTHLRVVILNKGYRILTETIVWIKRYIIVVLKFAPISTVGSIAHGVAEGEIEGCRLRNFINACLQNPQFNTTTIVPILTDTKLRLGGMVILSHIIGSITFHHIVSKTRVAQIF